MIKIKQTKRMLKCQFQNAKPSRNVYGGNKKQSHIPENDSVEI